MPPGAGGPGVTRRLLVASTNAHKVAEIRALLEPLGFEVVTGTGLPEVVEDGETFVDNARLKARSAAAATGELALADDSGIAVDALGGEPGVRSARYAGEDATDAQNNRLLVERLEALGLTEAPAAFVCAMCVAAPDGTLVAESLARAEGLVRWPAEGPGGFGYDPLFFHPPSGCRFSELSQDAKGAVSHRGQALRALARLLEGTPDPRLDP